MKLKISPRFFFRFLAALLFLFSLEQIGGGIYQYRAEREFNLRNFTRAEIFSTKGLSLNSRNLKLLDLQGRSAFSLGLEKKDPHLIKKAAQSFELLTRFYPSFGRGWIYKALTDSEMKVDWKAIKEAFEKGFSLEPTSAWVLNTVGRAYLSRWAFLSAEEKIMSLERIKKSLTIHDLNQPSSYLDESLDLIWTQTENFAFIRQVLPEDIYSYDRLLLFMESKKLWKYRQPIYERAQFLRNQAYESQIQKAKNQLRRGYRDRAFFEFQMASWIDNSRLYAQAGMLISGFPRKWWPFQVEPVLKAILEDSEEDGTFILPRLERVVQSFSDESLRELYQKRLDSLKSPEGEREDESPRLQELAETFWWNQKTKVNQTRLEYGGSLGMPVILKSGISQIVIFMNSAAGSKNEFAYARVRILDALKGKIIGEVYLDSQRMTGRKFEIKSQGGKKWLQVDLVNGRNENSLLPGPTLELGKVKIQWES